MSKFISKRFDILKAYVPGEQPQNRKYIKLNTNESPFPPSPKVIEAISKEEVSSLMLYPDPTVSSLTKAAAKHFGISEDEIVFGNGSDEILAFSFLAFSDKTPGVCYPDISYGFYEVYADLYGYEKDAVPLGEDFSVVPKDYYNKGKTIFIANPNAPTGLALSLSEIEDILNHNKNNLVVIDEAYADFGKESAVSLIHKYNNLLVVQTFSKSRNLAGARLGMAIGNSELISDLKKIKFSFNPYSINRLTLLAGTEAIEDNEYFNKCVKEIKENRGFTTKELEKLGFTVLPSHTNFIFAKHENISGEEMYEKLKENGILIRHFKKERIKDFIRITIGSKEEMKTFVDTVSKIVKETNYDLSIEK